MPYAEVVDAFADVAASGDVAAIRRAFTSLLWCYALAPNQEQTSMRNRLITQLSGQSKLLSPSEGAEDTGPLPGPIADPDPQSEKRASASLAGDQAVARQEHEDSGAFHIREQAGFAGVPSLQGERETSPPGPAIGRSQHQLIPAAKQEESCPGRVPHRLLAEGIGAEKGGSAS